MAKPRKKTRKELLKEPDEFITLSGRMIQFALKYKTQLTYGLGFIVAVAIVFSAVRFISARAETKASVLLAQSLAKYEAIKNEKKPGEIYEEISEDFEIISRKYGGKDNEKLARLVYADICFDAGKYDQAIDLYRMLLNDFATHPMIHNQILNNLGYCHEQLSDFAKAVEYFERTSNSPNSMLHDEALYHLGWLYNKLGQSEKSKQAFNKIISDHPDFMYIDLVKEQMSG